MHSALRDSIYPLFMFSVTLLFLRYIIVHFSPALPLPQAKLPRIPSPLSRLLMPSNTNRSNKVKLKAKTTLRSFDSSPHCSLQIPAKVNDQLLTYGICKTCEIEIAGKGRDGMRGTQVRFGVQLRVVSEFLAWWCCSLRRSLLVNSFRSGGTKESSCRYTSSPGYPTRVRMANAKFVAWPVGERFGML